MKYTSTYLPTLPPALARNLEDEWDLPTRTYLAANTIVQFCYTKVALPFLVYGAKMLTQPLYFNQLIPKSHVECQKGIMY